MQYNIGYGLQHPYESRYAIFRRFLVANPTLSARELEKIILNSVRGHCNSRYQYYIWFVKKHLENKRISLEPYDDYLNFTFNIYGLSYHDKRKKNCPVCAQQCYHSEIFELPWIERCPIHYKKILTQCPVCENEWPDFKEMLTNRCPGCGRSVNYSNLQGVFSGYGYNYYDPIKRIYEFINSSSAAVLFSAYNGFESRSTWPDVSNKYFPFYQLQISGKISKDHLRRISSQNIKILNRTFNIEETNINKINAYKLHRDELRRQWMGDERYQAVIDISNCIKSSAGYRHKLEVFDFALYKGRFLNAIKPLCPYCTAYSLWYYRICGDLCNYGVYSRNPFSHLVEDSADNSPFRPLPMNIVKFDGAYYEVSVDFQKWLYRRELRSSFFKIFNSINNICNDLLEYRGALDLANYYTESTVSHNADDTVFIWLDTKKMQIIAFYQDAIPKKGLKLPRIHNSALRCNEFKKSEDINELRSEFKHGATGRPISNGLNYLEYVKLEYGPINRYDLRIFKTKYMN